MVLLLLMTGDVALLLERARLRLLVHPEGLPQEQLTAKHQPIGLEVATRYHNLRCNLITVVGRNLVNTVTLTGLPRTTKDHHLMVGQVEMFPILMLQVAVMPRIHNSKDAMVIITPTTIKGVGPLMEHKVKIKIIMLIEIRALCLISLDLVEGDLHPVTPLPRTSMVNQTDTTNHHMLVAVAKPIHPILNRICTTISEVTLACSSRVCQ